MCNLLLLLALIGPAEPPLVTVEKDDTVIDQSCRVVIPKEAVIEDKNGDGVIRIGASDIVVDFVPDSILRGARKDTPPDEYHGYGVRLNGHAGVTLRGARISGYRSAIWATRADGLVVEDGDVSDCRRDQLRSTPAAEDISDWLSPHENDKNEWLDVYGAGIYVENSDKITVRKCRARQGQNGLCIVRVNDSRIYDNDFSFLSGWGIALWRSNRNVITRNAVDFCVRGYSHGVYNRGQDSAGFLVFEQCSDNVLAENSATHGGDGFFGFAGREALGEEAPPSKDFDYKRRGNNDNLLIDNDFSYAAAHGIEMTFSFGNRFIANRLVGNAICGVWGGYSQETLIAGNAIERNGEAGYGAERGGVNIEHGRKNRIVNNTFKENKCGIHLWWDKDEETAKRPWAKANGVDSADNVIAGNEFQDDTLAMQFRGASSVTLGPNKTHGAAREMDVDGECKINSDLGMSVKPPAPPKHPVLGHSKPVGARPELRGRENIVMTEWGPWDHGSPMVLLREKKGASHLFGLYKMPHEPEISLSGDGVQGRAGRVAPPGATGLTALYTLSTDKPGVHPYTLAIRAGGFHDTIKGTLVAADWDVTFFKWSKDGSDPRQNPASWRSLAKAEGAVSVRSEDLVFKYGGGGPANLKLSDAMSKSGIGPDYFGMIARTSLPLPKGKWRFSTLSDDGVRVTADGKTIIENWQWHTPTRDKGILDLPADKIVEIAVEYFEIDGFAVLEFEIAPD
jgi:parallel beta-helix repeat protein